MTYKSFAGHSQQKSDQCELCGQIFDWKHKQHECKRCSRIICYYCGPDKALIPSRDTKTPHRICKNCKDDQGHQKQLMEVENCRTGYLSNIGKRWAQLAQGDNVQIPQIQEEYNKNLPSLLKNASSEAKTQIQANLLKIYKENKTNLNYSLFDWQYRCSEKETDNIVVQKLSNILTCFFSQNPVKLTKNLVFIATYILYFCDEAIGLKVLQFLHQKVIPSRFQYHKLDVDETKPIEGEVQFLLEFVKEQSISSVDKILFQKLKVFFDLNSTSILTTFMFNQLEFYIGYFLFNQLLIHPEFAVYEKFLAHICVSQQKIFLDLQLDDVSHALLKSVQLEQFTTFLSLEDEKKRKYRSSINIKEQNQQSKKIEEDQLGSFIESIIELVKENQTIKIDTLISTQKFDKQRNAIYDLIKQIKKQREELDNQKISFSQLKSDYDNYLEFASKIDKQLEGEQSNIRISQNSQKSDQNEKEKERAESIRDNQERQALIAEQEEKFKYQLLHQESQHQQKVQNLQLLFSQSQEELKQKYQKEIEIQEENHRNEIAILHRDIYDLRSENNDLQIKLQQSLVNKATVEQQIKDKIQAEFESDLARLNDEKNQLLKKTGHLQIQSSNQSNTIEQQKSEIFELKSQIEELKKNSDDQTQLCARQNEQAEKLNKHIEELQIQIQGLKRKQLDASSTPVEPDLIKELQENNLQLRNQLLVKEKDLYKLKCSFVEINQQKIEFFDQIQNYEKETKSLSQKLQLYEETDTQKLAEHYETKIQLLEQTHEEQMNRLFSQFQQNQEQQQIITIQPQSSEKQSANQKKQEQPVQMLEIQQEQTQVQPSGQSDDCTIF